MDEFWQSFLKLGETSDPEVGNLLINIMETSEFYDKHKFDLITVTSTYNGTDYQYQVYLSHQFTDLEFSSKHVFEYIHKVSPTVDKTIFIKDLISYKFIEKYGKQNNYI